MGHGGLGRDPGRFRQEIRILNTKDTKHTKDYRDAIRYFSIVRLESFVFKLSFRK